MSTDCVSGAAFNPARLIGSSTKPGTRRSHGSKAWSLLEYTAAGPTSEARASADSVSGLAARVEESQSGDSKSLSFPPQQQLSIDGPPENSLPNANPLATTNEAKSPPAPLTGVAPSTGENQLKEYLVVQDAEEGFLGGYGMIILLAVLGVSTVVAIIGVIRGW